MASANNFYNVLFAYFKDGQYVTFPLFEDLGANQIVYIRKLSLPNVDGVLVPSYYVVAQDPKNLKAHIYYLSATDYYPTLASLCTALNALSTSNAFTCYTDLVSTDSANAIGDAGGSIIVNDNFCNNRSYNLYDNTTIIRTDLKQSLYYTQIVVGGDQTTAAAYYYDVYLS